MNRAFYLDDWLIEPDLNRISRNGTDERLRPQVMDLLVYFIRHRREVITSDDILAEVWAGKVTTHASIYNCVKELRHALHDDSHQPRYIKTIPKRGYQVIAEVRFRDDGAGSYPRLTRTGRRTTLNRHRLLFMGLIMVTLAAVLYQFGQPDREVGAPKTRPEQSVAVLPFADLSPEQDQGWFCDGIAEEILKQLTRIPGLKVTGRSSSFSFRGPDLNVENIGLQLDVDHLLQGSVLKEGERVHISAQLLRADDGLQLWSETFDRNLNEIFEVQNDISAAIIGTLRIRPPGVALSGKATHPDAYALYLQGRYFENLRGNDNRIKALKAYERALAIDPDYAPAWVGISWHYSHRNHFGSLPREEGYSRALEALEKALGADSSLASAWATLGYYKMVYDWDWEGAAAAIDAAKRLAPNSSEWMGAAATLAWALGKSTEHLRLRKKKVDLDPLNLGALSALGQVYLENNRPDEALELFERVVSINPDFPWIHEKFGLAYLAQGDPARALLEFNKYPSTRHNAINQARAHLALGNESEAQAVVDDYLANSADTYPYWTAALFAWRGDNDEALEWLEKAYQKHDVALYQILTNPHLKNLQGDPRYDNFLARLGLLEASRAIPTSHP
jgi:TolB-like protein/DNA-binding winged helix-turn-helix (wHTH) protein/Tfp pilus assembly protein PilF